MLCSGVLPLPLQIQNSLSATLSFPQCGSHLAMVCLIEYVIVCAYSISPTLTSQRFCCNKRSRFIGMWHLWSFQANQWICTSLLSIPLKKLTRICTQYGLFHASYFCAVFWVIHVVYADFTNGTSCA